MPVSNKSYTLDEVRAHRTQESCWVIHNSKVYDVSSFVEDHPGGEEYILDHAGENITALMEDELSHMHSEGAYEMLEDFMIGTVDHPATTATPVTSESGLHKRPTAKSATVASAPNEKSQSATDADEMYDFGPTDLTADKKNKFLDLNKPLLWQLWNSSFSKSFYLEQVHIPRHLSGSARIFGSPYLEVFTKTPWYIIPIFWLPIIAYSVRQSLESGLSQEQCAAYFVFGVGLWSLVEYVIHRFLFHLDELLPDTTFWLVAHFLLHGIHHYLPMDRLRLVMPPALAVAIAIPLNKLAHALFPTPQAYGIMGGALLGYVLYDLTHYYLHHAKVFKIHFKEMKTYHLAHHYKDFEGGYGITSKFWDRVFNTELQL
ncbi:fatty acid alpha-hydroxylase [Lunasporangiospora selenospora]|uniref:Ceramide very long chain fatty acid hydroxylase n=1 Tax=Lunasporangiospora selenospora TaxID=979761 RepID=A0A9P6FZY1_9FUNG|nr:fatty acid alpha-hydroxylase [Lunasporangiospora selenospora]